MSPPRDAHGALVGRRLGPYRLGRVIGQGGVGAVYEATHERTGRSYAVKVLLETDPLAVRRFRREAETLAALGHPSVVAIHDFDVMDGVAFMAMDLLHGEDLAARLERGPMSPSEIARVFVEISEALQAAHSAGILHRDLKPSNVWMSDDGVRQRAVLLDFGLARPLDPSVSRMTATGVTMGTPLYMSPEQARGEAVDARSDVYSLAALLYEMVVGAPPFDGPTLTAILSKVLTDPPPPITREDIAPRWRQEIPRAMAKDAASRPQSVAALVEALGLEAEYAHALPMGSVIPPAEERDGERTPRRRAWVWGLAATLAACAAGVLIWRSSQPESVAVAPLEVTSVAETVAETSVAETVAPLAPTQVDPALPDLPAEPSELPSAPIGAEGDERQPPSRRPTPRARSATPVEPPPTPVSYPPPPAMAENIARARQHIADYRTLTPFVAANRRLLGAAGVEPRLCTQPPRAQVAEVVTRPYQRIVTAREALCALHAGWRNPSDTATTQMERLRRSFERAQRDLEARPEDVLPPSDLAQLLAALEEVRSVASNDPFPCDHPAFDRLQTLARALGARAAQPALEIGYSRGRVCSALGHTRIAGAHSQVTTALDAAEEIVRSNIAAQEEVIVTLSSLR